MTKYRLKDAELQKKLDVWSKGLFSMALQKSGKEQLNSLGPDVICEFPGLIIDKSEIEVFEEYDPNDWNYFPDVMPPEDVLMRVETVGGDTFRGYFHTFPDGVGRWCCVCFTPRHMPLHETEKVKRYRPWD